MSNSLRITTPSDREIAMTRVFNAPRKLVFEAYTRPELLKSWLGVFGGWALDVCEIDLRVGGAYRYEWKKDGGKSMGVSGVFLEVIPDERLVTNEAFDDPWYKGEGHSTITFVETGGKTTMTMTLRYDSKDVRDAVLASPMEHGVAASYDKLEELLLAKV
jgi:uncharacterized protein YndB with AHSA1/START domain